MKKAILLAAAAIIAGSAYAAEPIGDEIEFGPASAEVTTTPGGQFDVSFNLTNTVQVITFEWWVQATDYFSVATDEDDLYLIDFGTRLSNQYSFVTEYNSQNHNFWVLAKNESGKKLMSAGEGLLCTMTFDARGDLTPGEYDLNFYDACFNWAEGSSVLSIYPPAFSVKVKVEGSGIEDVMQDAQQGDGVMYDLMGRRVDNPTPGLYLQDGRKVIVK